MNQIDVLIVDDEVKFAGMLSKRLMLRGIECEMCHTGNAGLDILKTSPDSVSLVLLDLNLPDIYGIQVMVEMKKINPAIPIIIVTGHGTDSDKKECLKLGALEFLNKPVRIETILKYLYRADGG